MLLGSLRYTRIRRRTIILLIHVDAHDRAGLDTFTRHLSIQEPLLLVCCQVVLQLVVNDEACYGFYVGECSLDSCDDCVDALEWLFGLQHQLNVSTDFFYLGESRSGFVNCARLGASLRLTVAMVTAQSFIAGVGALDST